MQIALVWCVVCSRHILLIIVRIASSIWNVLQWYYTIKEHFCCSPRKKGGRVIPLETSCIGDLGPSGCHREQSRLVMGQTKEEAGNNIKT